MKQSIRYALIALSAMVIVVLLIGSAAAMAQRTFTESDNGKTVTVSAGEPFMIRLAENPTTGYSWNLSYDDGLKLDNDRYVAKKVPANIVGSGGNHEWTFTPGKAGTYTISGIYKRPWEPISGNEQRYTLTVHAVGGSSGSISQPVLPFNNMMSFKPIQLPIISNIGGLFTNFPSLNFGFG